MSQRIQTDDRTGPERLLTVEDICRILRCKKSYVYTLTFQHRIPFIKIGRLLRFRESEFQEWLTGLTQPVDDRAEIA